MYHRSGKSCAQSPAVRHTPICSICLWIGKTHECEKSPQQAHPGSTEAHDISVAALPNNHTYPLTLQVPPKQASTQEKLRRRSTCRCDKPWKHKHLVTEPCCIGHGRVYCCSQAVEMENNSETQCMSVQLLANVETTAGPVSLLQPSCGSDRQTWDSIHVSPAACKRDEPIFQQTKMS